MDGFNNQEIAQFVKTVIAPTPKVHALLPDEIRDQLSLFVERVLQRLVIVSEICGTCALACNHVLSVLHEMPLRITRQFVLPHDVMSEWIKARLTVLKPNLGISDPAIALLHQATERYLCQALTIGMQHMHQSRRKTLEPRDLPIYSVPVRDREFRFLRQFVSLQDVIQKVDAHLPTDVVDQINNLLNWVAYDLITLTQTFKGRFGLAVRYLLPPGMAAHALQYRKLAFFHLKQFRKLDRIDTLDDTNTQALLQVLEYLCLDLVRIFLTHPVFHEAVERNDDFNQLFGKLGVYAI